MGKSFSLTDREGFLVFTMANYLLDFIETTMKQLPTLEFMSPEEKKRTMGDLLSIRQGLTLEDNSSETLEAIQNMGQALESVVGLLDSMEHPGSLVNVIDMMLTPLSVRVLYRQEQNPKIREKIKAAFELRTENEKRRKAFMDQFEKGMKEQHPDPAVAFSDGKPVEEAFADDAELPPEAREGFTGPKPEVISGANRRAVESAIATGHPLSSGWYQGFDQPLRTLQSVALHRERNEEVESDHTFKQFVVYIVVLFEGKVLCYQRGKKGDEARLHAKHSIGVGGHVNEQDFDMTFGHDTPFENALYRELKEEAGIYSGHINSAEFFGFVNNEADDVGKAHIGLVYIVELDHIKGCDFEDAMVNPQWIEPCKFPSSLELETWSQTVLEQLTPHMETRPDIGDEEEPEFQPSADVNDVDPDKETRDTIDIGELQDLAKKLLKTRRGSGKDTLKELLARYNSGSVTDLDYVHYKNFKADLKKVLGN